MGKMRHWTRGVPVEEEAWKQISNLAALSIIQGVAVMPDVHYGKGSTVGTVFATKGVLIPSAVGVDIGCGMSAYEVGYSSDRLNGVDLEKLRLEIERVVPVGGPGLKGSWGSYDAAPEEVKVAYDKLKDDISDLYFDYPELESSIHPAMQLGTLGTGNHFIEICVDDHKGVWIVLHSGSRGFGNRIGTFFTKKAKEEMSKWYIELPDSDLAYLPEASAFFEGYLSAVSLAQRYAKLNRECMMDAVRTALGCAIGSFPNYMVSFQDVIDCHHNYVVKDPKFGGLYITRKGAINAEQGMLGIIPGSMGSKSFIVKGKGERASYNSCSHGAGRAMSRNRAKALFSLEDHIKDTEGVCCRKDEGVLDETPRAYKDIDAVMEAQDELCEVVRTLKQVICVKG